MAKGPGNILQTDLIVETRLDNARPEVEVEAKFVVGRFIGRHLDV
jgi:hypothetical protein